MNLPITDGIADGICHLRSQQSTRKKVKLMPDEYQLLFRVQSLEPIRTIYKHKYLVHRQFE